MITEKERQKYIRRVLETRFKGQEVRFDSRALRKVDGEFVEFHVTNPNTKSEYFFAITNLEKAKYEVLVCVGDYYAFVIPGSVMREWNIKKYTRGYDVQIVFTPEVGWCATFTRENDVSTTISIDNYILDIKSETEERKFDNRVTCTALGMQKILGIR
jgi:arabinogalactan endo-1,4-beta-galactosidase